MASTASTEAALETDDLLDVTMPLPQASLGMFSLTLMFIYGVKKVRYLSKLIGPVHPHSKAVERK